MMKTTTTAKDIAKECGVSQATVSYVINNRLDKNISERTRTLVWDTAKKLQYFPNESARNIRKKSCNSIGLICGNNYENIGFSNTLRGIKRILDEAGYTITLLSDNKNPAEQCIKYYNSNTICGAIVIRFDAQRFNLQSLKDNNIPFAMISENGVWSINNARKHSFENGIIDCIKFCKEKNLKSIRYFTLEVNGKIYQNKYVLVKSAIENFYPECDFQRVVCTVEKRNEECLAPILKDYIDNNQFDIALSPNSLIAMVLQSTILKKSFNIPQFPKHISLVSNPEFKIIYPSITSFNIPLEQMGNYASRVLLSLLKEEEIEDLDFPCTLVHGLSTKL